MMSRTTRSIIILVSLAIVAGAAGASEVYIPTTDTEIGLALYNPGGETALASLAALNPASGNDPVAHYELAVAPGETWHSEAIGERLLGGVALDGLLRVTVDGRLIVSAWRRFEPSGGSGHRVAVAPWPAELAATQDAPRELLVSGESVETDTGDRIVLLALDAESARAELVMLDAAGVPIATRSVELAGGELRSVRLSDLTGWHERPSRISVEVSGIGRVLVLGQTLAAVIERPPQVLQAPMTKARTISEPPRSSSTGPGAVVTEDTVDVRGIAGDVNGDGDVDSADVACVTATIYDPMYGCAVASGTGDITGVIAGAGLSGGGLSGDVTLELDLPLYVNMSSAQPILWIENTNWHGIYSKTGRTGAIGVIGIADSTSEGESKGVSGTSKARRSSGVYGECLADLNCSGVRGEATQGGTGVAGNSQLGIGVTGGSQTNTGVYGSGETGVQGRGDTGVLGESTVGSGYGVRGEATGAAGIGIKGIGGTGEFAHGVLAECDDGAAIAAMGTNGMAIDATGGGSGESYPVARLTSTDPAGIGLSVTVNSTAKALILDNENPNGTIVTFRNNGVSRLYTKSNGETHMTGYGNGLNDATLQVENTSSAGIAVRATSDSTDATLVVSNNGSGDIVRGFSTSGNLRFQVENNGDVNADGTFSGGGADFAEMIPVREPGLTPGDVVALDADGRLVRTTVAEQASVVGVVSTQPGYLGDLFDNLPAEEKVPLAVVGIVPVKVTSSAGPIRPGDLLTPSQIPGTAMRANSPRLGTVIGKAMEPLEAGEGVILALISAR